MPASPLLVRSGSAPASPASPLLTVWRHPKPPPRVFAGRCIGRTDVAPDPRRAARLARRIDRWASRQRLDRADPGGDPGGDQRADHAGAGRAGRRADHGADRRAPALPGRLAGVVWTSPLERSAAVGRLLAGRGWEHHRDDRLAELDFGRWDGRPWLDIPRTEIEDWAADLLRRPPGGGETVAALAARVRGFCTDLTARSDPASRPRVVIGHGGWIRVARALATGETLTVANWSTGLIAHGSRIGIDPRAIAARVSPAPGADDGPGATC